MIVAATTLTSTSPLHRLQSLDALRGFDMFWIISGEGIFHGLAGVVKAKHSLVQSTYDYTHRRRPDGNLAAYVDRLFLPGKLHRVVYDPEGLLSTVPAVYSALLGVFASTFLRSYRANLSMKGKAGILVLSAVVFIALGWAWGVVFPINQNMWTSSFVLYAGGWSILFLAVFYFVIDVWGYRKWVMPFVWTGMNSILIYLLAHGMFDFEFTSRFLFGGLISFAAPIWHPALLWLGVAIVQFTLLYFLYHKKWLIKV